jgi:transcriptional regulator with AAA-type ATPase domain
MVKKLEKKEEKEELEEKELKELELIAYGCNQRVSRKLEEKLDEIGIHSFTFCEYFPTRPIALLSPFWGKVSFFYPFARRYSLRPLFPKDIEFKKENDEYWEKITSERRRKRTIVDFYSEPLILDIELVIKEEDINVYERKIIHTPRLVSIISNIRRKNKLISNDPDEIASIGKIVYTTTAGKKEFANFINFYIIRKEPAKVSEKVSKQVRREWLTFEREWWCYLQGKDKREVSFFYAPIVSNTYLYGVLLLMVPGEVLKRRTETRKEERKKVIKETLWEIAKEEYLPLLVIFHNYIREKRLLNQPMMQEQNSEITKFVIDGAKGEWLKGVAEEDLIPLEKAFYKMWEYRRENASKKCSKNLIKDTLIMPEYLVASPGMIKQLETALSLQITSQPAAGAVPCILIVGGSGTGKEKMAKLIAKYAPPFREALFETFNLAEGFYAHEPHASQRLIERLYEVFKKAKKEGKKSVVLVFDELNSLPKEVQGTLLRFIENKELPPIQDQKLSTLKIPWLGAAFRRTTSPYRPTDYENINKWLRETDILILGLTNEDPEKLTKVEYIYEILRSSGGLFAGFLGDFIYEQLRKLRRMREDLYYRMIRNGKIIIPELKERREDLPILFYIFLKSEIGRIEKVKDIVIEYEAFDELMNERVDWRGNIRELQAVCKKVATLLTEREKIIERDGSIEYIVSRFKIRKALRELGLLEE